MQIQPCGPLHGEITVPGDKSISHRAVMLGALANGTTHITGFLMGEDCLSTIDCFRKMGVSIDVSDKEVVVEGVGLHGLTAPECELYTGNSGTTTRLLSGILAGQSFTSTMNGDASIQNKLKVVFVPNYNVSMAELIIPASDVSEHISTVGKEASGTRWKHDRDIRRSNMKFSLNGALLLCTMDGSSIEIANEVGLQNV